MPAAACIGGGEIDDGAVVVDVVSSFVLNVFAFSFAHALLEAAYPPLKSCGAFRKSNVLVLVGGGAKKEGTATYAADDTRSRGEEGETATCGERRGFASKLVRLRYCLSGSRASGGMPPFCVTMTVFHLGFAL